MTFFQQFQNFHFGLRKGNTSSWFNILIFHEKASDGQLYDSTLPFYFNSAKRKMSISDGSSLRKAAS